MQPGNMILVYMLEPQVVGSHFASKNWPLHITLVPWFDVPRERHRELEQALELLSQATAPFTVTVGEPAQFGSNKDIPVHLIAEQDRMRPLHQSLVDLLKSLQLPLTVDHPYVGPEYTAHISQYEDRQANTGDSIPLNTFYLVELQPGNSRKVAARYDLKGHGDA